MYHQLNLVDVMEDLKTIAYEAITKYFTILTKTGYLPDDEIYKLLSLIYVLEFVDEYYDIIDEIGIKTINKVLECLYGSSCLIPYSDFTHCTPVTLPIYHKLNKEILEEAGIDTLDTLPINFTTSCY